MVVQYLSCEEYVYGRRFALPGGVGNGAIGYEIFREDGLVRFFSCDKGDVRGADLNRWRIPDGAEEMEFLGGGKIFKFVYCCFSYASGGGVYDAQQRDFVGWIYKYL